jgi:flagella basal body P-ring formation protein FlgA
MSHPALRLLPAFAIAFLLAGPAAAVPTDLAERVRVYLDTQTLPGGGEVEITVGEPDPRLQLAECRRYEPFVPPGARLWGRATLGVRCVEGATWTAYVPVHIRVFGQALVAARPLPRGATLTAEDVRLERLDLTQFASGIHGSDDAIEGKTTVRAFAAGEPLRRDALRAPPVVVPGDAVKVVLDGAGFALETDGKALSAAGDGEPARVSLVSGRVLTGVARPGKVVRVR